MPAAVCVTNGIKFWGTPSGNSPIWADSWAPIGLKYLRAIAFKPFALQLSLIISSPICLVFP